MTKEFRSLPLSLSKISNLAILDWASRDFDCAIYVYNKRINQTDEKMIL